MTTQPQHDERLHHLLDRLLRGVLLPEEAEQLAGAVRMLQARVNDQDGAACVAVSAVRLMNDAGAQRDRAEARIRELEAEVHRLTAGQCTHALAMCEQHHTTPAAGCPYPRCAAARATGRAATA
ncbi:hypothetical protein GTY67_26355 [Streptomyces sp. SID8374]|uniref:hypothetical protein n=1 Tax=Streptomyces sp. SID8374 TaxID=2690354 RepID=UPI00136E6669|nr:hypothetical protein [Streptomyces sp. SID8374]MYX16874.1 hypothetical protein [Streptomyces sp. SID8374]